MQASTQLTEYLRVVMVPTPDSSLEPESLLLRWTMWTCNFLRLIVHESQSRILLPRGASEAHWSQRAGRERVYNTTFIYTALATAVH
jgi:hypothetical protein